MVKDLVGPCGAQEDFVLFLQEGSESVTDTSDRRRPRPRWALVPGLRASPGPPVGSQPCRPTSHYCSMSCTGFLTLTTVPRAHRLPAVS